MHNTSKPWRQQCGQVLRRLFFIIVLLSGSPCEGTVRNWRSPKYQRLLSDWTPLKRLRSHNVDLIVLRDKKSLAKGQYNVILNTGRNDGTRVG